MTASPIVLMIAPLWRTVTSCRRSKCCWTSVKALRSPIRSYSAVEPLRSVKSSVMSFTPIPSLALMTSERNKSRNVWVVIKRLPLRNGTKRNGMALMSKPGGTDGDHDHAALGGRIVQGEIDLSRRRLVHGVRAHGLAIGDGYGLGRCRGMRRPR